MFFLYVCIFIKRCTTLETSLQNIKWLSVHAYAVSLFLPITLSGGG